jgi:pullulanase
MERIHARLVDPHTVELLSTKTLSTSQLESLRLQVHPTLLEPLTLAHESHHHGTASYFLRRTTPLTLGEAYVLVLEGYLPTPVNMTAALSFPDFDAEYHYQGDDLGSVYQPEATTFKVWAPLASAVVLLTYDSQGQLTSMIPMQRQNQGVYQTTIQGDCDRLHYRYQVTNHGLIQITLDPYGKGSSRNSEFSVVINFAALKRTFVDQALPPIKDYQQAIIYEAHVRDLSSDPNTTIPFKGTFLGAIQSGHRSQEGRPIGFDYVCQTGITHLQLLPVNDYRTVNEYAIASTYNWGYDPYQYFALEGSYASNPDDPYSRIQDFMALVSAFHQQGIRINIDVVFNHVYDYQHSVFEKVVPGYYFRTLPDGKMSNGSFCGNDLATEKPMVRKLIVDACKFWVETYHLDGFRFDLMGIIDITTLTKIKEVVRTLNPSFMLYGEGWDMPTHLPREQKGITEHAGILKDFAFFNDAFRNIMKGGNFPENLHEQGYATGNSHLAMHLPALMLGSSLPSLGIHKVNHPSQSINYVQCHDNHTFYDKLRVSNAHEGDAFIFRRIMFANALILFANGIPFFHQAQELGGSKEGDHNSYRAGDRINQFDYRLVDARPGLSQGFTDLIALRKTFLAANDGDPWQPNQVHFTALSHGAYLIDYQLKHASFLVAFNPSLHQIQWPPSMDLADYLLQFDGDVKRTLPITLTHLPPIRCLVLKQK